MNRDAIKQSATYNGTSYVLDGGSAAAGYLTFGAGLQVPSTGAAAGDLYYFDVSVHVDILTGLNAGKWLVAHGYVKRDSAGVLTFTVQVVDTVSTQTANAALPALTLANGDAVMIGVVPSAYSLMRVRRRAATTQYTSLTDQGGTSTGSGWIKLFSSALFVVGESAIGAADGAVVLGDFASAGGRACCALGRNAGAFPDYSAVLGGYTGYANAPFEVGLGAVCDINGFQTGTTPTNVFFLPKGCGSLMLFTNNATPTNMVAYDPMGSGAGNTLTLGTGALFCDAGLSRFKASLTAVDVATGDTKEWDLAWMVKTALNASSSALFGSLSKTVVQADAGASTWDVTVTVDSANNQCSVQVTGEASTEIVWALSYDAKYVAVYV
jgi:hypothetical protein